MDKGLVSLGSHVRSYPDGGGWEEVNINRWERDYDTYEYMYPGDNILLRRAYDVDGVQEISERLPIEMEVLVSNREAGILSKQELFVFTVQPDKNIDVLILRDANENIVGMYPYFVDHRDIVDNEWVVSQLRLGLFEV